MTWQRAIGGVSTAASIGLGAYGAHGLPKQPGMTPVKLKQFEAANRYQMIHSIALAFLPSIVPPTHKLALQISSGCFLSGTGMFAGGVYGKVAGFDEMAKASPAGGVLLMAGWVALGVLRR